MLQLILSIFAILITISVVIGIHEFSHFIVARLLQVKVLRFSIGFGKVLWRKYDKKGTEYVVSLIPLGGYVKMLDETEETVPESERKYAFNNQPFYKKFLIVFAGPFSNIITAFMLYWLIFVIGFTTVIPVIGTVSPRSIAAEAGLKPNQEMISIDHRTTTSWVAVIMRLFMHVGDEDMVTMKVKNLTSGTVTEHKLNLLGWHLNSLKPDPLSSLGITPFTPNIPMVIDSIEPESPAAESNLKVGDKISALNQKAVNTWEQVIEKISSNPGETIQLTIVRGKKSLQLPITVGTKRSLSLQKYGYIGIAPKVDLPKGMLREIKYAPIQAIPYAWQEIINFLQFNFVSIAKLIEGKISLQSLGGPITIFSSAGAALNYGIVPFLSFLAFLNIAIGVINFLPVPGLDGGHMLFQLIEVIIGRPISARTQIIFYRLGFFLLFFLILQAIVNDILRLY